jgi:hypothetical protein
MDAPTHTETATAEPTGTTPVEAAVRDGMDELLATMEAELALNERDVALEEQQIDSWDFEESIRGALDAIGQASPSTTEAASTETAEGAGDIWVAADQHAVAGDQVASAAVVAEPAETLDESLETVELELALHNQNLISLGFEESIQTALKGVGGEMLFQMRLEREDCQRIAAVRIGTGEEQQFALVIMPPGGGLMRVEPVEQSTNPLARITESYASLMDTFRAAA